MWNIGGIPRGHPLRDSGDPTVPPTSRHGATHFATRHTSDRWYEDRKQHTSLDDKTQKLFVGEEGGGTEGDLRA